MIHKQKRNRREVSLNHVQLLGRNPYETGVSRVSTSSDKMKMCLKIWKWFTPRIYPPAQCLEDPRNYRACASTPWTCGIKIWILKTPSNWCGDWKIYSEASSVIGPNFTTVFTVRNPRRLVETARIGEHPARGKNNWPLEENSVRLNYSKMLDQL